MKQEVVWMIYGALFSLKPAVWQNVDTVHRWAPAAGGRHRLALFTCYHNKEMILTQEVMLTHTHGAFSSRFLVWVGLRGKFLLPGDHFDSWSENRFVVQKVRRLFRLSGNRRGFACFSLMRCWGSFKNTAGTDGNLEPCKGGTGRVTNKKTALFPKVTFPLMSPSAGCNTNKAGSARS